MDFTGKVALVTGVGSGIGKATAVLFGKQGARVAALSNNAFWTVWASSLLP